ncbi:hypothetical protein [Peredibacter starrii]|uniref:Uncharacterized protein n=1 Tax=Peredibacter starrii TaxID=28202 RepID=A0AAX4HN34_9BACT|nr:hypothetical protein [Peredibacter starrii]WPU64598.1 hypothetical protein SOO65_18040 [Peredibacter starrii]
MIISLGFIRSSSQVLIKELNWLQNSLETRIIDVTDLADQNLQALFIHDNEHYSSLVSLLEKEKAFYPILDANDENLTLSSFESMPAQQFRDIYLKVLNRWTMHQNFSSIENVWKITNHFRELWKKDRITFFEEFWYWMKRNIGATEMTMLFNDVISTEEKDENNEKKERPKLTTSLLSGTKKCNFQQGAAKERELMASYIDKFHDVFEVTEFNPSKGQFVATAQIERSPIMFMARTAQLNQLQRTVLAAVFNGLQV